MQAAGERLQTERQNNKLRSRSHGEHFPGDPWSCLNLPYHVIPLLPYIICSRIGRDMVDFQEGPEDCHDEEYR